MKILNAESYKTFNCILSYYKDKIGGKDKGVYVSVCVCMWYIIQYYIVVIFMCSKNILVVFLFLGTFHLHSILTLAFPLTYILLIVFIIQTAQ